MRVVWMVMALGACSMFESADKGPIPVPPTPPDPVPVAPAGPCGDDCLLLMDHDYDELTKDGFCEACKDEVPGACDREWPAPDPVSCDDIDYLRNCMYARLGYTFSNAPEWRQVFEGEDWYEADEGFRWEDVPRQQARNASQLKKIVDSGRCSRD